MEFFPSFYDSSGFALWMKGRWKQEGFCTIPKRCSAFGFASNPRDFEVDFFSSDIPFLFSLCLGSVSALAARIVLGALSRTPRLWDLCLPAFLKIPTVPERLPRPTQTAGTRLRRAARSRQNIDLTGPVPQAPLVSLGHSPSIDPFSSEKLRLLPAVNPRGARRSCQGGGAGAEMGFLERRDFWGSAWVSVVPLVLS